MVVWAEVGNGLHLGILVLLVGAVVLLTHVVDPVAFIGLALDIHHGSVVEVTGVTLVLHVAFLLAVVGFLGLLGQPWRALLA
jgi:hypothetical protein